jgi:hypothetical protein
MGMTRDRLNRGGLAAIPWRPGCDFFLWDDPVQ